MIEVLPEVEVTPEAPPRFAPTFPKHLVLQVTARDVHDGEPGSPTSCAIARAAGRRFDGIEVNVVGYGIEVVRKGRHVYYAPDPEAHEGFIRDFDRFRSPPPTELRYTKTTAAKYATGPTPIDPGLPLHALSSFSFKLSYDDAAWKAKYLFDWANKVTVTPD